jgi:hypothetical protein
MLERALRLEPLSPVCKDQAEVPVALAVARRDLDGLVCKLLGDG